MIKRLGLLSLAFALPYTGDEIRNPRISSGGFQIHSSLCERYYMLAIPNKKALSDEYAVPGQYFSKDSGTNATKGAVPICDAVVESLTRYV
jgi:hypothetical protein